VVWEGWCREAPPYPDLCRWFDLKLFGATVEKLLEVTRQSSYENEIQRPFAG
jgi:hypothetical protein